MSSRDSTDPWLYDFDKKHLFLHFIHSTTYLLTASSTASLVSNDIDNNDYDYDYDNNNNKLLIIVRTVMSFIKI